MSALVLACGNATDTGRPATLTERDGLDWRELPATPGRADVDPLLKAANGARIVVFGTDADLAAVVLRVMRLELLAEVAVGFVPTDPTASAVPVLWGLPRDRERLAAVAVAGEIDAFPLIRDDAGGVLVGLGVIDQPQGVAYCDDTTALRGRARRIEVTPDPDGGAGLVVRVVRGGLFGRRVTTVAGRAFQIGCVRTHLIRDGVVKDAAKWTWYRHTEDLRIARGVV
ncbi:hypothetical protein V5P93_007245 [Actinokineospora auranticolor]|uniref:DAGKc domain-containing protein n=1 Tax=Actinokineospora auranticolor TaxID=155976 RepID=A0A2S6GRZ9_9PSEU|nr:hypothetical protein [Actinokineospora auranticolor]PPK67901.1 hypothetical protein CLV40_106132 [Actinokineospora auranticolor]